MAAGRDFPHARDKQGHEGERCDFHHDGEGTGNAQLCKRCDLPPVGLLQRLPDGKWPVHRARSDLPNGDGTQRVIDNQRGQCTTHGTSCIQPHAAESKPYGQWHLDPQGANLQPGHQQGLAQALVERTEHPENQGGWKRPG